MTPRVGPWCVTPLQNLNSPGENMPLMFCVVSQLVGYQWLVVLRTCFPYLFQQHNVGIETYVYLACCVFLFI